MIDRRITVSRCGTRYERFNRKPLLQFITTADNEQRAKMLPVLTTMLRLSDDEQQKLRTAAVSSVAGLLILMRHALVKLTSEATDTSWSAYLPRWSGIS